MPYPRDAQRAFTHQESGLKASLLTLLLAEGRAISDLMPVKSASIERDCEAALAESAARCATRGPYQILCNGVNREGIKARPYLASGLFCYVP
jgi:hypothetical protein